MVLDVARRGEARKQQRSCWGKEEERSNNNNNSSSSNNNSNTHNSRVAASRRRKEANFCVSISRDREDEVHKVIAGGFFLLVV